MDPHLPDPNSIQSSSKNPILDESPPVYLNPGLLYAQDDPVIDSPRGSSQIQEGGQLEEAPPADPLSEFSLDSENDASSEYLCWLVINLHTLDVPITTIKSSITFLIQKPLHDKSLDIGSSFIPQPQPAGHRAQSGEQSVLQGLYKNLKGKQLYEHELENITSWIIAKWIQYERDNYSRENCWKEVRRRDLPNSANIFSSHHFFEIKTHDTSDHLRLKFRLVRHGNHDDDKGQIRNDADTAQFPVIRFLLLHVTIHKQKLVCANIKSAFLQALGFFLEVYVNPPRGLTSEPDIYWLILKPAYGLFDTPSLWQLIIDSWLFLIGCCIIPGLHQLFHLNEPNTNAFSLRWSWMTFWSLEKRLLSHRSLTNFTSVSEFASFYTTNVLFIKIFISTNTLTSLLPFTYRTLSNLIT